MKIVYLWKDGHQVLVFPNDEGEYVYPTENWTEQAPPEGIYAPFYYDGQKWIGQSKEDFEKGLEPQPVEIDEKDNAITELTSLVVDLTEEVSTLQLGMAQIIEQHANNELEAK